jgi:hypothetical protein
MSISITRQAPLFQVCGSIVAPLQAASKASAWLGTDPSQRVLAVLPRRDRRKHHQHHGDEAAIAAALRRLVIVVIVAFAPTLAQPPPRRLLHSFPSLRAVSSIPKSTADHLIAQGKLCMVKVGHSSYVTDDSVQALTDGEA